MLNNTIIAGNTSNGNASDWVGKLIDPSSSFNLIGNPATAGGLIHGTNGNIVGDGLGNPLDVNAVLDTTLADNGGPTLTHALVPGSPAINAGSPWFDPDETNPPMLHDQRGPGFDRVKFGRIDIGAFEGVPDPLMPINGVINVSTFDDVLGDDGFWSLREAVIYANSHPGALRIQLAPGIYNLTRQGGDEEAALTGDLDILNDAGVEIVGAGSGSTTINAAALFNSDLGFGDRIFDVKPGAVLVLKGLTLTGGDLPTQTEFSYQRSGGAILNAGGQVVIIDAVLSDNSAVFGGAIHNGAGVVQVTGTIFTGNSAGRGGSIGNEGLLSVEDSAFSGNIATRGGAVYSVGDASFTNVQFTENRADQAGGAIVNRGRMTLTDGSLAGNWARQGGAIYNGIDDGTSTVVPAPLGQLTITGSTIDNNTATDGGGIYNDGAPTPGQANSQLSIFDSTLSNNVASLRGGGLHNRGGEIWVTRGMVSGNSAIYGGGISSDGAATIVSSTLSENSASTGGGIYIDASRLLLVSSTVSGNAASTGGGASFNQADVTIERTTLSANSAASNGGGVYNTRGKLTTLDSTFSGNSALLSGGGIYSFARAQTVIRRTTITGNWAEFGQWGSFGGGIMLSRLGGSLPSTIDSSIVAGNIRGVVASTTASDIESDGVGIDPTSSYNLIGDPNSAGELTHGVNGNIVGDGAGNLLDIHSVLDVNLADNGGPTLTHALVPGSPAVNAGDPLFDPNAFDPPLAFDQRGATFARVVGGRVDIGAFELGAVFVPAVVGRHIFYDNSKFDGDQPGVNANLADFAAIAPDKQPLRPGDGLATAANVTSYARGINGLMIDIAGATSELSAADFEFRVGNSHELASWTAAPPPAEFVVHAGLGIGGSDRVVLTWASGSITNTWLEVRVRATANTGLTSDDVFYWGNRIGDTFSGVLGSVFMTNVSDEIAVRLNSTGSAPITNPYDFNRNGQVNAADEILARQNPGFLIRLDLTAALPLAAADTNLANRGASLADRSHDAVAAALSVVPAAAAPSGFAPHAESHSLLPLTPDAVEVLNDRALLAYFEADEIAPFGSDADAEELLLAE